MSSPSMVFGVYAPQTSPAGARGCRLNCGHGCRCWPSHGLCCRVHFIFWRGPTSEPLQRIVEAIFGYDVCVHWDLIHFLIRKQGTLWATECFP